MAVGFVSTSDGLACKTIGGLVAQRVVGHKGAEAEGRYTIRSRERTAADLALSTRAQGSIESRLHGVLNVSFGEEGRPLCQENAPQNLALLKKIVPTGFA